jgi:flavin-binding protein dodecin
MSHFDQFIKYRALRFKFDSLGSSTLSDVESHIESGSLLKSDDGQTVRRTSLEEAFPQLRIKNVCAKLSGDLVDRLDNSLSILGMSKRDFIEMALVEALDRVDQELADIDAFEFIEAKQSAEVAQESKV